MIQAVRWQASEMPPSGKLRDDQVAVLVKWVELGAPWPGDQPAAASPPARVYDWPKLRQEHWAWRPVERPALPTVQESSWAKNPIDLFVLDKLEAAGFAPNPPAEPRVLLRRLCFDLTGLPPTPEEVEAFLSVSPSLPLSVSPSSSPDGETERQSEREREAIEAVVDNLLASPQYGERWGRHWLDVARYSDGYGGFLDNAPLPNAWRYRDWVVAALNRDLPYDEFVRLQMAGDLLDPDQAVATGFLALGPTYISDGGDPDATAQAQAETLDDRVDTVTRGLLGDDRLVRPLPRSPLRSVSAARLLLAGRCFPQHRLRRAAAGAARSGQGLRRGQPADQEAGKRRPAVASENPRRKPQADRRGARQNKAWTDEAERLKTKQPEKYPFQHVLADKGSMTTCTLAIRGNLPQARRASRRGASCGSSAATIRRRSPAAAAGWTWRKRSPVRESADGAGHRQPPLAAAFWPGARSHAEQFRHARREAVASRNCSTGWRPNSIERRLDASSTCIASSSLSATYQQDSAA